MFLIAGINGIVWGKFVVAGEAKVVFSRCAVMTEVPQKARGGKSTWDLVFRLANNQRRQTLMHVKLTVSALIREADPSTGEERMRSHHLKLEREYLPMLVVNGEIRHHVDENSPLWGLKPEGFTASNVHIRVVIEAVDTLFRRDKFDMHVYGPDDLRWNHRLDHHFMHMDKDKGLVLHMEYFHDVEVQSSTKALPQSAQGGDGASASTSTRGVASAAAASADLQQDKLSSSHGAGAAAMV